MRLLEKHFIPMLLLFLALGFAVVFWQTFVALNVRWSDSDSPYSHSYVVIVMSFFLLWSRTRYATLAEIKPNFIGVIPLVLGLVAWYMGHVTQTQVIEQTVYPFIFLSWIVLVLGNALAKRLALPILLCVFTVPIWGVLLNPLRLITVEVSSFGLKVFDIPAFIDGYRIHLPAGVVEVAGGCSGLNYLVTALVIGSFYGMYYLKGFSRVFPVIFIAMLALLANWIRVFSLIVIGHETELQHPLIEDHGSFGWWIFGGAIVVFFIVMRLCEKYFLSLSSAEMKPTEGQQVLQVNRILLILSIVLAVGISFFVTHTTNTVKNAVADHKIHLEMPERFTIGQLDKSTWVPYFSAYDQAQFWQGELSGERVEIVALTYLSQVQGKELIHYENRLAREGEVLARKTISLDNGQDIGYFTLKGKAERAVYWVYLVGDKMTTSPIKAKLLQAYAVLSHTPQAAVVAVSRGCGVSCGEPNVQLLAGLEELIRAIKWSYVAESDK